MSEPTKRPTTDLRRTFLAEKKFQYTLVGYWLMMAAAMVISMYLGIYSIYTRSVHQAQAAGLINDDIYNQFIARQQSAVTTLFIVNSIVIFAFMGFFALFLSHRIAGPLFRVRRHLENLANGEPAKDITFRKNDYFQDLAHTINRLHKRIK